MEIITEWRLYVANGGYVIWITVISHFQLRYSLWPFFCAPVCGLEKIPSKTSQQAQTFENTWIFVLKIDPDVDVHIFDTVSKFSDIKK